jgi:hypothetical protein
MGIDPPTNDGADLLPLLAGETDSVSGRDCVLYGYFGSGVNVTDGRYTYLHPPADTDASLYRYGTRYEGSRYRDGASDPAAIEPAEVPYAESPVWRVPAEPTVQNEDPLLYDVTEDPRQTENLATSRPRECDRMRSLAERRLRDLGAPTEQFDRLGL